MKKKAPIKLLKNGFQINEATQFHHIKKGKTVLCPDCGERMGKVFIKAIDNTPILAGFGSCRCPHPVG